jgi:hypothetical protein
MVSLTKYFLLSLYYFVRHNHNVRDFKRVESGPFAGMKLCSEGSWTGHAARLLGTYEKELVPVVEEVNELGIANVIDFGCDDGYYSCGFAFKYPSIRVSAYDLSRRARCCTHFAGVANGIAKRLTVHSLFDITSFTPDTNIREMLLLDCEGFEAEIVNEKNVHKLVHVAMLIECHDFIVPNITSRISGLLAITHSIHVYMSQDRTPMDLQDLVMQRETLVGEMQEGRPCSMPWIWAVPLSWSSM